MKLGHKTSDFSPRFRHHTSSLKHQTSSDCTGGRKGDEVRYCQSEQNTRNQYDDFL